MRPHGCPKDLERRRMRAVQLVEQGESPTVIARILGVAPRSVRRWQCLAREGGLHARPASGRPRLLSDQQLRQLEDMLRQGAMAYGWRNQLWTGARVATVMARYFGVHYHPDHALRMVKT